MFTTTKTLAVFQAMGNAQTANDKMLMPWFSVFPNNPTNVKSHYLW